ncbi:MAG: PAS domain S-box protein [Hydrogenophaga sp.]|uniref:PAS domain S-box protein n=1 Tax=Hydrogenophaga sp. TaxID=1904254 RepID=UPI001E15E512|nr:PAS domain S-box protein [Hydrogenophaga sp.]MBX3611090.1 PAS domain S-box protein [Hydrogenophaga sp.]
MSASPPTPTAHTPLSWWRVRLASWEPSRRPMWQRLLVAALVTALLAWMRVALAPAESGGRFITLSLAAAVCALYGGFRVGMFSTLLGMLFINFLLVKPYFSLAFDNPVEAFWLNLWHLLTQVVVVGAIALMQRQYRMLRESMNLAQRSHQQMLDTFEHSATGMAHTRVDGTWIRINQKYCDLIGYSRTELQDSDWRRFTHPEDLQLDLDHLATLIRGEGDSYTIEKRYIHRQGHTIWVVLSVSMMRTAEGAPDYLVVVVQDISQRKRMEEQLRTTERLLFQAQELAGMASWLYDAPTRTFTTLSNSDEVLSLPAQRFTDQEMLDRTHPDDLEYVKANWGATFRDGAPYNIEYRLRMSGDDWRWYQVRGEFERDERGKVRSGLGCVLDITERKLNELHIHELNASLEQRIQERTQELKAAYDELESYSYAVAHDLRSPLRIINGFAQALEEDNPELDTESRKHLERIREASKKMGELIDGLLHLSQMARGELQREPVDLSRMATRQLRELAASEPERNVQWEVEPGLLAMADGALVEALLQNLLHNAWKYTGQTAQARIRVSGRWHNGVREFSVSDNGAGFDMARASKLFQPFQRLHMPNEFKGLGIGLATARRIVVRHGGWMQAQAQTGQGATFTFTLQPSGERYLEG